MTPTRGSERATDKFRGFCRVSLSSHGMAVWGWVEVQIGPDWAARPDFVTGLAGSVRVEPNSK